MATFTVGEFIDAMEKNGYKQDTNGTLFIKDKDGNIESACALGQAILNLGLPTDQGLLPLDYLGDIFTERRGTRFGFIWDKNDNDKWPVDKIARWLRNEICKDYLEERWNAYN